MAKNINDALLRDMFNDGIVTVYPGSIGYDTEIEYDSAWKDYSEFVDYYSDYYEANYGVTESVFEATKDYLENLILNANYYGDDTGELYIEICDDPIMNWIDSDIDEFAYDDLVQDAIEEFENQTGVEVFILGRSGKHVCVEFTLENLINYESLKAECQRLQKELINSANDYPTIEESFGYDTSVDDPEIYEIDASLNKDIDFDKKIVNREELFDFVQRVADLYEEDAPENEILAISTFLGDYDIYISVTQSLAINEDIDDDNIYNIAREVVELYKDYDFYDFRDCYDSDDEGIFETASALKDENVDNVIMYLNYIIETEAGELKERAEKILAEITDFLRLNESLTEDLDDEDEWIEVESKYVYDSNGFMDDYTMYKNSDGTKYIFMYGDKDIYEPDEAYADWVCETEKEAYDWFDSYEGTYEPLEGEDDSQEWLDDPDIGIFGFADEPLEEDVIDNFNYVESPDADVDFDETLCKAYAFEVGVEDEDNEYDREVPFLGYIPYKTVDENYGVCKTYEEALSYVKEYIEDGIETTYGVVVEVEIFKDDFDEIAGGLFDEFDYDLILNGKVLYAAYKDNDRKYVTVFNGHNKGGLKEDLDTAINISWDDYEDYSEDEIEEINDILDNYELSADKVEESNAYDDFDSVLVRDSVSGYDFWIDFRIKDGEIEYVDWNQYIFSTRDHEDRIRKALQTAYSDDWSFFNDVEEVAEHFLLNSKKTNENISESIKEDLDLDLSQYNNGFVEMRDGKPNFVYDNYTDAFRGMCFSKMGDTEPHEYKLMKLVNGELKELKEDLDTTAEYAYEYSYSGNPKEDTKYFIDKYTAQGKKNVKVKRVKTDTKGMPMYKITWESNASVNEAVTTTPIATYYISGDLGIIIYNINYGIDDEVVWAWSNTPDEIETSAIEYEYGDTEYDSRAFFMADDEKVYLDDCLRSFHESIDNNSNKSFETMSLTALNKLPREKLIQITKDFMNRYSEFYEDFTDFFDWHFGERFGYSDLEDLVTEDIAWFYFNIVKNAKKDHPRSFHESEQREIDDIKDRLANDKTLKGEEKTELRNDIGDIERAAQRENRPLTEDNDSPYGEYSYEYDDPDETDKDRNKIKNYAKKQYNVDLIIEPSSTRPGSGQMKVTMKGSLKDLEKFIVSRAYKRWEGGLEGSGNIDIDEANLSDLRKNFKKIGDESLKESTSNIIKMKPYDFMQMVNRYDLLDLLDKKSYDAFKSEVESGISKEQFVKKVKENTSRPWYTSEILGMVRVFDTSNRLHPDYDLYEDFSSNSTLPSDLEDFLVDLYNREGYGPNDKYVCGFTMSDIFNHQFTEDEVSELQDLKREWKKWRDPKALRRICNILKTYNEPITIDSLHESLWTNLNGMEQQAAETAIDLIKSGAEVNDAVKQAISRCHDAMDDMDIEYGRIGETYEEEPIDEAKVIEYVKSRI